MRKQLDLGHGHTLRFFAWAPDRELNPQYDGIPDEPRAGAIIDHPHKQTGAPCSGHLTFDTPVMRRVSPDKPMWQVLRWEPLTLDPSVQCSCGDHGFVQEGKWVPA